MAQIFIAAIAAYLLFVACYFLWERQARQKRDTTDKKSPPSPPKGDIIGKSAFRLRQSLPEATTLIESEKEIEKPPIFAPENVKGEAQSIPAVIPPSELDRVFSSTTEGDDGNEIIIDDGILPENEPGNEEGNIDQMDVDEAESEDTEIPAEAGAATGLGFDDLAGMLRTVEDTAAATPEEKEDAGRTLVEIRKTDLFEQVVSGEPEKKTAVSRLMDDYFAAYQLNHPEAHPEPAFTAPDDFDMRDFA
jgi:hypothetical protein